MSTLGDQDKNNLASKKWVDNLLVKDEQGKFTTLGGKEIVNNQKTELAPAVSEGHSAPKDDNFAPIQYISGNSQSSAKFAFHPDDDKEAEALAKSIPSDESKKYGIEKIVDRIITKQEISLDSNKKDYFTNILFDFFRDRKNAVTTRDRLTNDIKLKPEKVDAVLSVIKSIKSRIDSVGGLVIKMSEMKPAEKVADMAEEQASETDNDKPQVPSAPVEDKPDDKEENPYADQMQSEVEKALKEISQEDSQKAKEIKQTQAKTEPKKEPSPAPGFDLLKDKKPQEKKEEVKKVDVFPVSEPKSAPQPEISLPKVSRPMAQVAPKKQITDVQKSSDKMEAPNISHVLTGPVREIESFDLITFRRLGSDAQTRVDKILDKINLLEQDSYTKKAQGIKAWRNSPLYKLYLQLGTQSMSEGKEVSALIDEMQKKGQDTLSFDEFSAISDLNQKIRF